MAPLRDIAPLQHPQFNLDSSGIAGFFGGDEAISAMETVHVYQGRKWLGWYNPPGSYLVAKTYGRLANSKLWNTIFPGARSDPASLFGFNGRTGPQFLGVYSGTRLSDTGHTGFLLRKRCESLSPSQQIEGRITSHSTVTVVKLETTPEFDLDAAYPITWSQAFIAFLCMLSSFGACAICGMFQDWYCFSMILLGILCNGFSCFVIGSLVLRFHHPTPAKDAASGDGLLHNNGSDYVILLGEEGAVNSITRGSFLLEFSGDGAERDAAYTAVGLATTLLTIQFLLQLLLIPQGTLFGQIMFLSTLAVSWAYNCYLSSLDGETIQADILTRKVLKNPPMTKYMLGTHTATVVFLVLVLRPPNPDEIFDRLLPDNETWRVWKRVVSEKMRRGDGLSFTDADVDGVTGVSDQNLLRTLFGDTTSAYQGFIDHVDSTAIREKGGKY